MAITKGNIDHIRQYMNEQGGVANSNRYQVMIATPPLLIGDSKNISGRGLSVVCDSAPLPGISYSTGTIEDIGPEYLYPYTASFEDLELSFFCSESMQERIFFDAWFESISPITETNFPKFSFRDDYVTTITMDKLNHRDERVYSLKLIEAYPITMSDQEMGYDSNDALKLSITFNYSRWVYNDTPE